MKGNQLITKHSAKFDSIEKSKRPGVLLTIRGPVTGWKPNRNGRTYSRELWEKALNSDYVKEQVALNHFVGEADHPEERLEPVIQNMSHAMRDFEFDDANEEIIATIDILDTPCGNMLKTLYDYSGALSFSTRGSGDVLEDGEVDPDTYQLFAIDAVLRPSYATATVRDLLTESENLNKDKDVKKILESYSGSLDESVSWEYFDRFSPIENKYLPSSGEGETMATQVVTAVSKLVYKWYNDGDIYDNSNPAGMTGWANDLSSYANWLAKYVDGAKPILDRIFDLTYGDNGEYEDILKDLCDLVYDEEYLDRLNEQPKEGSVYDCDGDYSWDESRNYDEEYDESENLTEVSDEEPKAEKEYYILKYHKGRYSLVKGTIERLTDYFGYTLLCGHSWNSKINQHPTTLKGLVNSLNASYAETQGSCYDPDYVSIPTPEQIEEYKDTIHESEVLSESDSDYLTTIDKNDRLKYVYLMDRVIRSLNDEDALYYSGWLSNGVPDGDTEDGFEEFKNNALKINSEDDYYYVDNEDYIDLVTMYRAILRDYAKDGFVLSALNNEDIQFLKQEIPNYTIKNGLIIPTEPSTIKVSD